MKQSRRITTITVVFTGALLNGCGVPDHEIVIHIGDPLRGRAAMSRYECGACHRIPGVAGARGRLGPALATYRHRLYIAGRYPNVPTILAHWIRDAPSLAANTAMPDVGVTAEDAHDMAAYLHSLE